jgi:hypothetical protein
MGRKHQNILYIGVFVACILIFLYFIQVKEGFEEQKQGPKGIILDMMCGLGNQLYIYAAGKMFQRTWSAPIYLKLSPGLAYMHTNVDYRPILFSDFEAVDTNNPMFQDKVDAEVQQKSPIHRFWDAWSPENLPKTDKYIFLETQWYQDYKSIEPAIPEVRDKVLGVLRSRFPDTTVDEGSAFLHVRRGDYTKDENKAFLLDTDYYLPALNKLNAQPSIKAINIFSDDIAWCKQQQWISSKTIKYIDEPDEMKALYMMSLCDQGAVISNSTFSTWGAILGSLAKGSIIVYPSKWLYGAETSFPSTWIRI